jgi:hypothetical protein
VKIDGELWEKGKLFIHGDTEPEAIIDTKGKSTVDIEGIKKYLEEYVTKKLVPRGQLKNGTGTLLEWEKIKENENAENKG